MGTDTPVAVRIHSTTLAILYCFLVHSYTTTPCRAFTTPVASTWIASKSSDSPVGATWRLYGKRRRTAKHQQDSNNSGGGGGFGTRTPASERRPPRSAIVSPAPAAPDTVMAAAARKRKARRQAWSVEQPAEEPLAAVTSSSQKKGSIQQLSEYPLIFTIDNFIDPELCRRVNNNAEGCFHLLFPERVSDQLFRGQESDQDGLLFNANSSADHDKIQMDDSTTNVYNNRDFPDGLHMDTNNQCVLRHVTCILYLNDVPEDCGGATVFPLAQLDDDDDDATVLCSSRRLLAKGLSHTRSAVIQGSEQLQMDAQRMETMQNDFLRIQPKAGRLLVFFSRDETGEEDPRAWHAGERLTADPITGAVTEKRILTLFKEVHYDGATTASDHQLAVTGAYMAPMVAEQRHWLQALAQLQTAMQ